MEQVGNAGSLLGDGWVLVVISGTLLAIGLLFKLARFRAAGWHSLLAHAFAGLVVQLLKRLIGRPRPRFTHGDEFLLAPSLTSGFDSFPSGHATASFAVAVALAKHFPRAAWMFYGLAALIAISRLVRGSHFPTDVAVGAILGLLLGLLVVTPRDIRWKTIRHGLIGIAPYIAGAFALLWIAMQPSQESAYDRIAFTAGMLGVLVGVGSRLSLRLRGSSGTARLPPVSIPVANGLIVVGLALSTGSLLVLLLGVLVSVSWALVDGDGSQSPASVEEAPSPAGVGFAGIYSEAILAALLIAGLAVGLGLKGILPLL